MFMSRTADQKLTRNMTIASRINGIFGLITCQRCFILCLISAKRIKQYYFQFFKLVSLHIVSEILEKCVFPVQFSIIPMLKIINFEIIIYFKN